MPEGWLAPKNPSFEQADKARGDKNVRKCVVVLCLAGAVVFGGAGIINLHNDAKGVTVFTLCGVPGAVTKDGVWLFVDTNGDGNLEAKPVISQALKSCK